MALGIAAVAAADPQRAALDYIEHQLLPKSAASLRHAVRAARFDYVGRVRSKLATVERLYLDELMRTRDAVEGLTAFIAKRPPHWEHR
jgi:cyclohexa-1,5-dienecarbonyl-CoA hydratase